MSFSKIRDLLNSKKIPWILFTINLAIFLLLLFKNPFSERNLIPNLEPYPDTIHYLTPALSFIKGNGFYIEREGRIFKPTVPFLYSLTLVPIFLINPDARMFYFTNLVIAFVAFGLFYAFLTCITSNKFIPAFVGFLYVTNYFIYWYPNLAMAENLGLLLFIAALFLLVSKLTLRNSLLVAILSVCLYATKYANFTLSFVLVGAYCVKIFTESKNGKVIKKYFILKQAKQMILFLGLVVLAWLFFFLAEYLIRGDSIFLKIQYLMQPLINPPKNATDLAISNPWFSYSYFNKNLPIYLNSLLGEQMRFLWDFTPLLPKYLAVVSLLGFVTGLFSKGSKLISSCLILFIFLPIIFLSTFYAADARYIYHVIPSMLAGLCLFLSFIYKFLSRKKLQAIFYIGLLMLFAFYSAQNIYRIKYQIALNLRHSETPWNYLGVKFANDFFNANLSNSADRPILISAIPPYYVDYFSKDNYQLLPLSKDQEFSNSKEIVWGKEDYSDLIKIYVKYLKEGRLVYLSNAGLGNQPYLHRDFNAINDYFALTKLKEGCFESCNIYQVTLKK